MSKFCVGLYGFFFALFVLICYLAYQSFNFPGDTSLILWLQGVDLPFFNPAMQAVSYIASSIQASIIVALVSVGLWAKGRKREPIFLISLTSFAALLGWLLKLLVGRPRPENGLIVATLENNGFSFPSGHMIYATVFYGFIFYLTPRLVSQPVVTGVLRAVLILLILLTGVSRVYLGAHWPSDVLGSSLLGVLLLVPTVVLYNNYNRVRNA